MKSFLESITIPKSRKIASREILKLNRKKTIVILKDEMTILRTRNLLPGWKTRWIVNGKREINAIGNLMKTSKAIANPMAVFIRKVSLLFLLVVRE
jgi:hypothetical protein